jgi:hypothetical protein
MRHADVSTTLKVYTHVMKHRRDGVAERLDAMVFGNRDRDPGRKEVATRGIKAGSSTGTGDAFGSTEP